MEISYNHTLNPSKGMGDPLFWGEFFFHEKRTTLRPNPSANLISVKRVNGGTVWTRRPTRKLSRGPF